MKSKKLSWLDKKFDKKFNSSTALRIRKHVNFIIIIFGVTYVCLNLFVGFSLLYADSQANYTWQQFAQLNSTKEMAASLPPLKLLGAYYLGEFEPFLIGFITMWSYFKYKKLKERCQNKCSRSFQKCQKSRERQ